MEFTFFLFTPRPTFNNNGTSLEASIVRGKMKKTRWIYIAHSTDFGIHVWSRRTNFWDDLGGLGLESVVVGITNLRW